MADPQNNSDAYDTPWKDVLEHAFPEFVTFYEVDPNRWTVRNRK